MKVWFESSRIEELLNLAHDLGGLYGIKAIDSLHLAAAILMGAGEFITSEGPSSPFHRYQEPGVKIVSIY